MKANIRERNKLVLALRNKDAYPHQVYLPKIKIYETHISWIFLTGLYAYKIKKEVKFGKILDFLTLYLRRKFCKKEIQVNKILCGDMYKGIVNLVEMVVLKLLIFRYCLASTLPLAASCCINFNLINWLGLSSISCNSVCSAIFCLQIGHIGWRFTI
jgi:hypothetical protein